ncbi:uncharacterized protein LOC107469851 isoform X3 [Arachis duranensis]|uniref:RRM domain-containing protein n=2 Tax=Arachis TaxID=3817 RepID=A0A445B6E5_ARAHY|nr:uncharacterized protein LOC107469851 isoform X3 [Arachis duranensis]XP_025623253.1 RNA-binding protein 38 isoform X2 [Arachis hypogaea]RYR34239.1 hypothetical protein Ahy_A10g048988 isoform B [Arachis hypogaea]
MSRPRQNKMLMNPNTAKHVIGDTTYTKIFVGGLAWETKRDTLKRYFDQFGEILEAVVITDRNSGRSKGYGFVTFKDPNSAIRACQNPYPVIDGRRANCNLASLGAQKIDPSSMTATRQKFSSPSWNTAPIPVHQGTSTYYNQHIPQYTFPYPPYRYPGYPPQQEVYEMQNYYNAYGGQHFPFRWLPAYYQPIYGLSRHQFVPTTAYVKKTQFPDMSPQEFTPTVASSEPISASSSISTTGLITGTVDAGGGGGVLGSQQEQKSSSSG